jgi:hypothetical protein
MNFCKFIIFLLLPVSLFAQKIAVKDLKYFWGVVSYTSSVHNKKAVFKLTGDKFIEYGLDTNIENRFSSESFKKYGKPDSIQSLIVATGNPQDFDTFNIYYVANVKYNNTKLILLIDWFGMETMHNVLTLWKQSNDSLYLLKIYSKLFALNYGAPIFDDISFYSPDKSFFIFNSRGGDAGYSWGNLQIFKYIPPLNLSIIKEFEYNNKPDSVSYYLSGKFVIKDSTESVKIIKTTYIPTKDNQPKKKTSYSYLPLEKK